MITITINEKKYNVKTCFEELTISEYLNYLTVQSQPAIMRLSKATGVPITDLQKLTLAGLGALAQAVEYIENSEVLSTMCADYKGKDVSVESYGKVEQAKGLLTGENYLQNLPQVVEIYTGEPTPTDVITAWPVCFWYLDSLTKFFDRFKELNNYQYEDDEIEAGVETLEPFKHWPVVFKIGKERGMTNDQVLELSAVEVYTEMLYNYRAAEYEKSLTKIKQNRQEHFAKMEK